MGLIPLNDRGKVLKLRIRVSDLVELEIDPNRVREDVLRDLSKIFTGAIRTYGAVTSYCEWFLSGTTGKDWFIVLVLCMTRRYLNEPL